MLSTLSRLKGIEQIPSLLGYILATHYICFKNDYVTDIITFYFLVLENLSIRIQDILDIFLHYSFDEL